MRIYLIRHGMTAGNRRRAYIGRTDEPLCEEGISAARDAAGTMPACDVLAVSPMLRCIQTASILYPGMEQRIVPDLRETDFGSFEGKNAADLTGDSSYQAWIDSGGTAPFPGGESPKQASARCCRAFAALTAAVRKGPTDQPETEAQFEPEDLPESPDQLKPAGRCGQEQRLVIVTHGGTIMAILEHYALPEKDYYAWHADPLHGYTAWWDGKHLTGVHQIGGQDG